MPFKVTEGVIKLGLRVCSHRTLFHFRSVSLKDTYVSIQSFPHIWSSKQSQTCFSGTFGSPVKFYSQRADHNDELQVGNHLLSPSVPPDEIQSGETLSAQRQGTFPFFKHLQCCGSPSDVLGLTCKYSPTIEQISHCFSHMWSTTKNMSYERRRYELQLMFEQPAFDKLLQMAMKNVGRMGHEDINYCLLSMVSLGVPQRSRVVQTFLRACQDKLNDFDEKSLSILASSLKHMEEIPNVVALRDGMRLVVEGRLPRIKSVKCLQSMMGLVGKDAPRDLRWKLEKKALSMMDQFSLPNAQYMISIMAIMNFHSKPLLSICSKMILENLHLMPFNRLYEVLLACKELMYRDIDLLTGISEYVASFRDIFTNKQVLLILSVFESLGFCPAALMEANAEKVISNPEVLTLRDILCVLKVYSSLNYDLQHQRQKFLDSVSHVLNCYLPKMSGFELLRAVHSLSVMGHFPSAPLEHLLQESMLEQLAELAKICQKKFQTLDLCLRLDRPTLPQPLTVPTFVQEESILTSMSIKQRLAQDLKSLLGDQEKTMLQEMVVVENFYFIDGVVTKPLTNQTCVTEAGEQFSSPEKCQRFAVIYTPNSGFCYGTSHPRGALAVKLRHLKILGYDLVLVTESELQLASQEKRVDYLRGHIFPENRRSETLPEMENLG
ncbi:FAST kinase domain-containing protein 2, mitochondrial isoform 2-T2 [Pholidichthys leucotaenia]